MTKPKPQPTQKVEFIRNHRHAGKDYKPGDPADVTASAQKKLKKRDVIK